MSYRHLSRHSAAELFVILTAGHFPTWVICCAMYLRLFPESRCLNKRASESIFLALLKRGRARLDFDLESIFGSISKSIKNIQHIAKPILFILKKQTKKRPCTIFIEGNSVSWYNFHIKICADSFCVVLLFSKGSRKKSVAEQTTIGRLISHDFWCLLAARLLHDRQLMAYVRW